MIELEVYKKSDFYEDYISSQKEYYERENANAYFAERLDEKDKEIADLEESHKKEVEQLLMEIVELKKKLDLYKRGWEESDRINAHLYAKLRHQKFKRCLAMAKWCENENVSLYSIVQNDLWKYTSNYWLRWRNKWLELAEKFKEAK